MLVKEGWTNSDKAMSSQPTTATSSGTLSPLAASACNAPIAQ
jgi:hypothetical protein